jgi:GNAT superfamily N-acetyltransferase
MKIQYQKINQESVLYLDFDQSDDYYQYGYLHFHLDTEEVNIMNLYDHSDYRGRGYATQLMHEFLKRVRSYCSKNDRKKIVIKVDDVSENFGKKNNIYKKFGFEYCDHDDVGNPIGPEMISTIQMQTDKIYEK